MSASKKVRKVQELRRSNAAGPIQSKKKYSRKKSFIDAMAQERTEVDSTGLTKGRKTAGPNSL